MKAKDLNTLIRSEIKAKGLTHYEVATALGITPATFSTWLQSELSPARKKRIRAAIRNYTGKKSMYLNTDIRETINKKGLALYEIANELQIAPGTFAHWLQKELTQEQREKVLAAIERITE